MSRKQQRRDYNGRQGSAQRPWEQEGGRGRGNVQRNQYDNIGRDRYGSNTGEGGGYGSRDWDRGDDEGSRPTWPGEQGRQQHGSQGYGGRNDGAQRYDSRGYGSADEDRGEEYGDQRYGGESSRRYRSQGFGGDQGMSRYQSGGYGQNYGDDSSRGDRGGNDRGYQNWGEGDAEYGGSNQSQRNFDEGNWYRGQGDQGRSRREGGRSDGYGGSQGGYGNRQYGGGQFGSEGFGGSSGGGQFGGSSQWDARSNRGMGSLGQHSGRGPKGYRRGDDRIQEDISEQLTQHPGIDASEIEVKVSNGEVTLTGTVDNREAKRLAEDIAEDVSGVTEVQNQIRVQRTVGAARDENEGATSRGPAGKSGSSSSSTGSSSSEGSKSQNRAGAGIGS